MKRQTKRDKLLQQVKDNLTHHRLKADLAAVEGEIYENQPRASTAQNFFDKVMTDFKNEIRKDVVGALTIEKKAAQDALAAFEKSHDRKQLALLADEKKWKTVLDKKLFKGDKYNLAKMQFALAFMLQDGQAYQRESDSLEAVSEVLFDDPKYMARLYAALQDNFVKIHNVANIDEQRAIVFGLNVASLLPFSPVIVGGINVIALINAERKKQRMKQVFRSLSGAETNMLLATKLTLIQMSKENMPKAEWGALVDEYLRTVNNFRSDAEYEWLVEQSQVPVCKEKIAICDLCVNRLSQVVGA